MKTSSTKQLSPLLTHGGWLLVAVVAFVIGRHLPKQGTDPQMDDAATTGSNRAIPGKLSVLPRTDDILAEIAVSTGLARDDHALQRMTEAQLRVDEGEFRVGRDRLVMTPKGCFWNDQKLTFEEGHQAKLPEKKIKMISSPNLDRKEKDLVRLRVESQSPYQYMTARKDGLFELQEVKLPTGLDIKIKAHQASKKHYEISYLKLDLRSVSGREKSKETNLPVGKPVLDESEFVLKLKIRESHSYGIALQPKGTDGLIIVRLAIND